MSATFPPPLRWKRSRAGLYRAATPRGEYVISHCWSEPDGTPDEYGWQILYPDGEVSEMFPTLREAQTGADQDAVTS